MTWKTDQNQLRPPWWLAQRIQWLQICGVAIGDDLTDWSESIPATLRKLRQALQVGQALGDGLTEPEWTQAAQVCQALEGGLTEPEWPQRLQVCQVLGGGLTDFPGSIAATLPELIQALQVCFSRTQVGHECQHASTSSIVLELPVRSPEIDLSELAAAVAEHLSDNYRYDVHRDRFERRSGASHQRVEFNSRRGAISPTTQALIKAGVYLVLRDNCYSRVESRFATEMIDFANERGLWGPDDALVANSGSAKAVAKAVLWAVKLLE
jgi:hypothetical protein